VVTQAALRVLDRSPDSLEVTAGPDAHRFEVACNTAGDVPAADMRGATHVTIRRLPDKTVVFDRTFPAGSQSVIVVSSTGTAVVPLDAPSYGPPFLGTCAPA
jgi:hypothetical protein